jgi:hypothetical protein
MSTFSNRSESNRRIILPPEATEIAPVSSDTTTAMASVFCEIPIAARWRNPN